MSLHTHAHSGIGSSIRTRLWWAFWINLVFFIVELGGGIFTHSLALLSDAGHMVMDVLALGLAIFVSKLSERIADNQWTYGYVRAEVMGAFINGGTLVFICGFILFEAVKRLGASQPIDGGPMLIIATLGLAANGVSAWILADTQKHDLNTKGAYLHLMTDTFGSVAAILSAVVIWIWHFYLIDVIASILIALLILVGTKSLLTQSIKLLMDTVPDHLDYELIKQTILDQPHVENVHDLHIWSISQHKPGLSAHLQVSPECIQTHHWADCLNGTKTLLREKFKIEHCTLQIEPVNFVESTHCG
ncbi:MAG: cation transporter [Candidatus Marinimicrobia bacterium]|nr:cation transporter [Candidatus Neomarinimicrobiota bacterium]